MKPGLDIIHHLSSYKEINSGGILSVHIRISSRSSSPNVDILILGNDLISICNIVLSSVFQLYGFLEAYKQKVLPIYPFVNIDSTSACGAA